MNQTGNPSPLQRARRLGSRLGLERMESLMALLGNPEKHLKCVHVAGTNGKGSVCAMLSSVLAAAGLTVGLYTSPHLVVPEERIRINGRNISPSDFRRLENQVARAAESLPDEPTEFELMTAMALLWFYQNGCDIVILEVGLGGRLDATNVIPAPEAAVIMNIGLDHTEVLGDTLEQIAGEKAGIIKTGCPVIAYPAAPEVERVCGAVCAEKHAPLYHVRREDIRLQSADLDGQRFCWKSLSDLHIRLPGLHQAYNAAAALETLSVLRARGWNIPEQAIRRGLADARWPARLEVLRREPLLLLDGAHNPQCAQALADSLRTLLPGRKFVFLTGVLADKDYPSVLDVMLPLAQEFICLTPDSERALSAQALAGWLKRRGAEASFCGDAPSGVQRALAAAGRGGCVVAFGSLYLAGMIKRSI